MRKVKKSCADTMDGVSKDIPGQFRSIYKDLYNCVDDAEDVAEIKEEVETKLLMKH